VLTCRDVTERATDYMERALPLRASLAMRMHLGLCAACRAYLGQMRMTVRLLRGRSLGTPPADLAESLIKQARTHTTTDSPEQDPDDSTTR
jgi:predicted anti-sigma-YlaC factor YlaD